MRQLWLAFLSKLRLRLQALQGRNGQQDALSQRNLQVSDACWVCRSLLAAALQPFKSTRDFERMQSTQVVVEGCQMGMAGQARNLLGPSQPAVPFKLPSVRSQATALGIVDLTSSPPAPRLLKKQPEDAPPSLLPAKAHSAAGGRPHAMNKLAAPRGEARSRQEAGPSQMAAELRSRLVQRNASQSSSLPAARPPKAPASPGLKQTLLTSSMSPSPSGPGVDLNHRPDRGRDAGGASMKRVHGSPALDIQQLWAEAQKAQELHKAAKKHKEIPRKNGKPGGLSNLKAMIKRHEQQESFAGRRIGSEGQRPAPRGAGQDTRPGPSRYSSSYNHVPCIPVPLLTVGDMWMLRMLALK